MEFLPPESRIETVTSAMSLDGHLVSTRRFTAPGTVEATLASLRERCGAEAATCVESRHGGWAVLSVRDGEGWRTVQLRARAGGVEGLETRWTPQPTPPAADLRPPVDVLPVEARVVRRIAHDDPGREAATVVALVDAPAGPTARGLRARATRVGFVADPALGLPAGNAAWFRGGPDRSGEAIALRRDREEIVATVAPHRDGTAVVLHWSRAR